MPVFGVDQVAFAAIETNFDTLQAVVGSQGFGFKTLKIQPTKEFHKSEEQLGSASLQNEIAGKVGGRWEGEVYTKPQTAGSAPDCGPFHRASGMAEDGSDYDLSQAAPLSLQIVRHVGDELYQVINGAWVEQVEAELTGNAEPVLKFSGGFATYGGMKGAPQTDATGYAQGSSQIGLGAGHPGKIFVGAVVAFGDSDNGGDGYTVTAISANRATITISPTIQAGEDIATAATPITPVSPTPVYVGTIQGGIACNLSIDDGGGAVNVGLISYKSTFQTGIHGMDKEAHTDRANRLGRGKRVVEGEIQFYFLDETAAYVGRAWDGDLYAVDVRFGPATANNSLTISHPALRLAVPEIDVPPDVEAIYTAPWVARASAGGNDEIAYAYA